MGNTNKTQAKKQLKCKICNDKDFFYCQNCLKGLIPKPSCFCEQEKPISNKLWIKDQLERKKNGCINNDITNVSVQCMVYSKKQGHHFKLMKTFSRSKILNSQSAVTLISIFPKITHLRLIYDTTEDEITPKDFHGCCDGVLKTVVLVKSDTGRIAGGYNDKDWDGNEINEENLSQMKSSDKAFLFSVDKKKTYEFKNKKNIIICHRELHPEFRRLLIRLFSNKIVY